MEQHDPAYGRRVFSPGIYRLLLIEDGGCRVDTQHALVLRAGQVGLFQRLITPCYGARLTGNSRWLRGDRWSQRAIGAVIITADEGHYQPNARKCGILICPVS